MSTPALFASLPVCYHRNMEQNMEQIKYWVALGRVRLLGTVRFRRLEAYFGEAANVWKASFSELKASGMEERVANEIIAARSKVSPDDEMANLARAGVKAVNWHHPDYPARLKEIHDPPPVLYYKGELLPSDERSVAVVGTRSPTTYGREVAASLTAELARNGIAIVSGLALGIDGIAHRAALDSGERTLAVVANGLDIVYPKEHANLSQRISEQGAVVSEVPLGIRPDSRSFPRRNRLISGISLGTLVVEAGEGSGARWTVYHALEQDREVFCVPGSIFSPASHLTNRLIQEGAKLVSSTNDIMEELNLNAVGRQIEMRLAQESIPALSANNDAESKLLGQLDHEPIHIDDIRRRADMPITEVSGLLTMLELKGMVKQVGCMHYVRIREASPIYGN
ncbi:MAG: DNA-processing protein DprA [Chloroflexi bacterium]|nr:DNA-processing protein DprA [Chloroflexota bacterium]